MEGIAKLTVEGQIFVRPFGIAGDVSAVPLIIRNASYTFTPAEGVCELVADEGAQKTFRVKLPLNAPEATLALSYEGPMPAESAPITMVPQSCRQGNVTTVNLRANASSKLQAEITAMTVTIAPPLVNSSGEGTKPVGSGRGCEVARDQPEGSVPEAVAANSMEGPGDGDRRRDRLLGRAHRGHRARPQGQERLAVLPGHRRGRLPGHSLRHLSGDRRGGRQAPALHVPEARVPCFEPLQVLAQGLVVFVLETLFYFGWLAFFEIRVSEVGCARDALTLGYGNCGFLESKRKRVHEISSV